MLQTATVRDWTAYDAGTAEALAGSGVHDPHRPARQPATHRHGIFADGIPLALLAALLGFLLLRRSVNRRLIAPISAVKLSIDAGWALLPVSPGEARAWAEPLALTGRYRDALESAERQQKRDLPPECRAFLCQGLRNRLAGR